MRRFVITIVLLLVAMASHAQIRPSVGIRPVDKKYSTPTVTTDSSGYAMISDTAGRYQNHHLYSYLVDSLRVLDTCEIIISNIPNDDQVWNDVFATAIDSAKRCESFPWLVLRSRVQPYMLDTIGIDPYDGTSPSGGRKLYCIELEGRMGIRFEPGARVQVLDNRITPNDDSVARFNIFIAKDVDTLILDGITIDGNATGQYQEDEGYYGQEYGHGIQIYPGGFQGESRHIILNQVTIYNHSGDAVQIDEADEVVLNRCRGWGLGEGYLLRNVRDLDIRDYFIHDSTDTFEGDGLELSNCTQYSILNPRIMGAGNGRGSGIDWFGSSLGSITGGVIDGWVQGITAEPAGQNDPENVTISGVTISNCTGTGVLWYNGLVSMSNCIIFKCERGIDAQLTFTADAVGDKTYIFNTVIDSCTRGIRMIDSTNLYLRNVDVLNSTLYGIEFQNDDGLPYLEFHGGKILGSGTSDIFVNDGGDGAFVPIVDLNNVNVETITTTTAGTDAGISWSRESIDTIRTNKIFRLENALVDKFLNAGDENSVLFGGASGPRWQDTTGLGWGAGGGGSDLNFAHDNLTFNNNRTHTLGGFDLILSGTGSGSDVRLTGTGIRDLIVESTDNNSILQLQGQTIAYLQMYENDVSGRWDFAAIGGDLRLFNEGASENDFQIVNVANSTVFSLATAAGKFSTGVADATPDAFYELNGNGSDEYFQISASEGGNGDIFEVDATGLVGINDNSPSFGLDVNGTGRYTGAIQLDHDLLDINVEAGTSGQLLKSLGGSGAGIDWSTLTEADISDLAHNPSLYTASSTLFSNVVAEITTSATFDGGNTDYTFTENDLVINGDGSNDKIKIQHPSSGGSTIRYSNSSQAWEAGLRTFSPDGFHFVDATAGTVPLRIENGARDNALVLEADDDLGIGTLNPTETVHILDAVPTILLEDSGGYVNDGNDLSIRTNDNDGGYIGWIHFRNIDDNWSGNTDDKFHASIFAERLTDDAFDAAIGVHLALSGDNVEPWRIERRDAWDTDEALITHNAGYRNRNSVQVSSTTTLDATYFRVIITDNSADINLPEIDDTPDADQVTSDQEYHIINRSGGSITIYAFDDTGDTNDDYFNGSGSAADSFVLASNESVRLTAVWVVSGEGDWDTNQ